MYDFCSGITRYIYNVMHVHKGVANRDIFYETNKNFEVE